MKCLITEKQLKELINFYRINETSEPMSLIQVDGKGNIILTKNGRKYTYKVHIKVPIMVNSDIYVTSITKDGEGDYVFKGKKKNGDDVGATLSKERAIRINQKVGQKIIKDDSIASDITLTMI